MRITRFPRAVLRYAGHLLIGLSERIPYSPDSPVDILERHDDWVTCRVDKVTLRLNVKHYVDSEILKHGVFEPNSTRWLHKLVKPGMVVADVGANFGYYTLRLSQLVGPTGRVHAFEPVTSFRQRLIEHVERNHCSNVFVVEHALSDSRGSMEIYQGLNSGLFDWFGSEPPLAVEKVKVTTLDDYVVEKKLSRLDFIKVDIDGHETHFVRGASKTLREFQPILLMEFAHLNLLHAGSGADQLASQLKDAGYILCSERTGKPYRSHEEFLIDAMNCAYSVNVFCFPSKLNGELISD